MYYNEQLGVCSLGHRSIFTAASCFPFVAYYLIRIFIMKPVIKAVYGSPPGTKRTRYRELREKLGGGARNLE